MKTTITLNQIFRNCFRLQRSCFSAVFLLLFLLSSSSSWGQIAQRGSSTTASSATTNNTTITINKPTGVVAGDVLLFSVVQNETDNDNGGLSSPTLSGWTLVKDQLIRSDGTGNNNNAWFGSIYYRVSDGSEGSSFTFAMNSRCDMAIGSMVAFSGVACNALKPDGSNGGPFDITPGNFNNADSATATATGVTVANNNSAVIMFAMCNNDRSYSDWSNSQTELFDNITTNGDDASVGAAWLSSVNSGATGNRTVTLSSSDRNSAILLVLRRATTMTAGAASSTPTLCVNTALTNITHTTTGATGIGTATGLPSGVTPVWASNTITISGTPTNSGIFTYSIPLTGGCGTVNATGTITVAAANTTGTASSTPTLCINTELTNITHTTTVATGIGTATGLPEGVTPVWASNTITISGTPTNSGIFTYSIPLTGGCGSVNATGTITVNSIPTTTNTTICPGGSGTLSVTSSCADITEQISGPNNAGIGANLTGSGSTTWSNPGNITAVGSPYATVAPAQQGASNYLMATNYGFSIPANAIINGIQLTISRSSTQSVGTGNRDDQVRLVKNNNLQATDKSSNDVYPTSLQSRTYGSGTDLWGTTWTAADINNSGFGAVLSVFNTRVFGSATATVDFMQITVTYTIPGSFEWYTVSSGGTAIGSGANFNPVGVANSGLANTNTAGTTPYWVACSTAEGSCRAKADFIINALPTVNAGTAFTKTCIANTSGAAIGETAVAGHTYLWSPSTGLSSATASNPTANPSSTTTYTVTKTNTASGCTATGTVTVTVNNSAISVNAGTAFTK
ncbi:MAG: hypothetical protein ACOYLP_11130, partial [Flavobacterium sp.]|uniref:hypothetical protein n=1 Tax=Flavobacterium sp. TaxID=239 RepID=UPI003BE41EC2